MTKRDKSEPKPNAAQPAHGEDETILLKDLAPKRDVKGGSARRLFGESGPHEGEPSTPL